MNVNFRGKNFVIATFFHDYCHTAVPARIIHVIALSTILTRGIGLEVCKCEEKRITKILNHENLEP